ncbi:hypothetical protein [Cupriavidus necator]|nr:hypothetical protein [Cupriavidus necator]
MFLHYWDKGKATELARTGAGLVGARLHLSQYH